MCGGKNANVLRCYMEDTCLKLSKPVVRASNSVKIKHNSVFGTKCTYPRSDGLCANMFCSKPFEKMRSMISRKICSLLLIWNSLGTCVYREMSTEWQTASLTCACVVSSCLESPMMFGVLSLEYPIRKCNYIWSVCFQIVLFWSSSETAIRLLHC